MTGGDEVSPLALVVLVLGVVGGVTRALLFRSGRLRRDARHYWDEDAPWYLRNLPFALLPLASSAAFLVLSYFSTLVGLPARVENVLFLVCALGFVGFALLAVAFARKPPEWTKPDWLRAEEVSRRAPPSNTQRGLMGTLDRFFIGLFVWTAILSGAALLFLLIALLVSPARPGP